MASLTKLQGGNFVIIGRAGMDMYPDPPGSKTETATSFFSCLGGSSANIGVAISRHGGRCALVTTVSMVCAGVFLSVVNSGHLPTCAVFVLCHGLGCLCVPVGVGGVRTCACFVTTG